MKTARECPEKMGKFWLIYLDNTTSCSYRHATLEEARAEAERLVRLPENMAKGAGAFVLEAVGYCKIEQRLPPVQWWEGF